MEITEKINSFEAACKDKGIDPLKLPDVSSFPERLQKYFISLYKLIIIAEALRQGWKPDYADHDQKKWFAVFRFHAVRSAFGFDYAGYYWAHAYTIGGPSLVFQDEKLATYFGAQFIDLHQDILCINE